MKRHIRDYRVRLSVVISLLIAWNWSAPEVGAATYYVSQSNGNDNYFRAQATSVLTPWLTIQRAANNAVAGDTVMIRAGTYRETVTVSASGTANAPITFQAYPNETVTVSGSIPVSGWMLESPNVYYSPISLTLGDQNQIFQNSQMKPEARWPNAGSTFPWQNSYIRPSPDWAYVTTVDYSVSGKVSVTSADFPDRWTDGYWNGATMHVVPGQAWVINTPAIGSYTNSTKTMVVNDGNTGVYYGIQAGNEFYLSGKKEELDSPGEWFYDSGNSRLYFYATSLPANVEAKARPIGFDLKGSFIRLANLEFFACTIQTSSGTTDHVYDAISMKYVMHSRKQSTANRVILRDRDVLRNSDLGFASESLVYLSGNDIRVVNNHLHDAGYGNPYNALISGVQSNQRNLLSHNTIHDSGRTLVGGIGRFGIIQYNDIYRGVKLTSDGANVYANNNPCPTLFHHNLVHDAEKPAGQHGSGVRGVYLDNEMTSWTIHHNIFWNIVGRDICLNARFNYHFVFNNTCFSGFNSGWPQDGEAGAAIYNNLFATLNDRDTIINLLTADARYNLYSDPGFVVNSFMLQTNSVAVDRGVPIPGVTDGFMGSAPDLGALEVGAENWTNQVGWRPVPPSPDPIYAFPDLVFANRVADGSFETASLSPNWSSAPGGSVSVVYANAWGTDGRHQEKTRTGFYGLSFGVGASQVGQTVSGLVPGARYKLFAALRSTNTSAVVTMRVKNYGNPIREQTVAVTESWAMNTLSFVTGSNSTSAEISIDVVSSDGTKPVYLDDTAVVLINEPLYKTSRPLVHYRLNETNGLTALDSSGNGRNATLTSGPSTDWTNGVRNGGLYFNGSDHLVTPSFAVPPSLTVACWARSASATWSGYGCLISQRPSFVLHPVMGSRDVRFLVYSGPSSEVSSGWSPPAGFDITQWHHYAGVFDPAHQLASLYVDGIQVATRSVAAMNLDSGQIIIGKDDMGGSNRNFKGVMDDVRVYDYPLSKPEIQDLMDTNLVLHLALDDPAGSSYAWDSTGLGESGVLSNMIVASVWTNGILNGALRFDGANDVVITPPIATPAALTASCWAKSATANWNASGCLVAHRPAFVLSPIQGTRTVEFVLYTDAASSVTAAWTAPSDFDLTQWHHYAGVFDPTSQFASLYVDGVPAAASAAVAVNPDKGQIFIGQDSLGGANRNFEGVIDDVRLYSRALAWHEMLELASLTSQSPYSAATAANPRNFKATVSGSTSIALAWIAADFIKTGYKLDYRLAGAVNWTNLAALSPAETAYNSTGLMPGNAYDYRLQATNAFGGSGYAIATATTHTSLQEWRQLCFLTTTNSDSAADAADPDHDGMPNLVEYALVRNPTAPDSDGAFAVELDVNGSVIVTFLRARSDVIYVVESSTFLPGDWSAFVTNPGITGTLVTVSDTPSSNSATRFYRLKVSMQQ